MSDEAKTEENKGLAMYVHQVQYKTLLSILEKVTDVNKTFVYTMPSKAQKYASSGFELINTLNEYIDGEQDWRIAKNTNVKLEVRDEKILIGQNNVISGTKLVLCIPRINSIIIIPDQKSLINGVKDPTKIIQLTNCISVMPLLVKLLDERDENDAEKFILGMSYEIIIPKTENEKPS